MAVTLNYLKAKQFQYSQTFQIDSFHGGDLNLSALLPVSHNTELQLDERVPPAKSLSEEKHLISESQTVFEVCHVEKGKREILYLCKTDLEKNGGLISSTHSDACIQPSI